MHVLGIETSCDDTSLGIIDENYKVIFEISNSQIKDHNFYGGVVPELASRKHVQFLQIFCKKILDFLRNNNIKLGLISVTQGPGLIGSLMPGIVFAKTLARLLNVPILGVNHLEGHFMSLKLTKELEGRDFSYPLLFLLLSGGHSHIYIANDFGKYELLGKTLDDAAGECFDKVSKFLKLGYPGGCVIEKLAKLSKNKSRYKLKIPMEKERDNANFSFSGLKTQIYNIIDKKIDFDFKNENDISDLCFATQEAIVKTVKNKLIVSISMFLKKYSNLKKFDVFLCGGVSANLRIQEEFTLLGKEFNFDFFAPPLKYCGDNGVMIAIAGLERYKNRDKKNFVSDFTFLPYSTYLL